MEWEPGTKGMFTGIRPMSSLIKWEKGYSYGVNKKEFWIWMYASANERRRGEYVGIFKDGGCLP